MPDESGDDVKAISTLLSVLRPLDQDARVHVLEFVLKRLGISLTAEPVTSAQPPVHTSDVTDINPIISPPSAFSPSGAVDIRGFVEQKKPKTVNEKVATIAYYLAHLAPTQERRGYIVADDIKTHFIQAGFQLPTAMPNVTLGNAKNAGYLVALDRGQFRLNAVGHNLVVHKLPSEATAGSKPKSAKKPASKKPGRKVKK